MKHRDIKTENQFEKCYDCWKGRTKSLANICIDVNETMERRQKAANLCKEMYRRVYILASSYAGSRRKIILETYDNVNINNNSFPKFKNQ